ncbi:MULTISPECIES: VanZ family protein [Kitasatospora]|nr:MULTISPECIES: VanZ family protein [Kitasatospora]
MISAILNGSPGMIPAFAVLALLLGWAALRAARRYGLPPLFAALLGVSLAGELTATFYPTGGGGGTHPVCGISSDLGFVFDATQGWMNILMFVPVGLFAVLALGRPLLAAVGTVGLSALTETGQGLLPGIGRACDSGDFAANTVGGLLGVLAGCALGPALRRRTGADPGAGRRLGPDRREWKLGGALAAGIAVPVVLLQAFVFTPVGVAGALDPTAEQRAFAQRRADALLAPGTEVTRVQRFVEEGYPEVLAVMSKAGSFNVRWPSGDLVGFVAGRPPSAPGQTPGQAPGTATGTGVVPVGEAAARAAADRFAAQWLVGRGAGTEPEFSPLDGTNGRYRFGYTGGGTSWTVDVGDDGTVLWFGQK